MHLQQKWWKNHKLILQVVIGAYFPSFSLSPDEFLLKGSSCILSVHFYACLLFYTSNRVMCAFLVTPAEAWKGSTFHFHYISFISLFWRKGSMKYKTDIAKISFSSRWKALLANVSPPKAAELQVTIRDLEKNVCLIMSFAMTKCSHRSSKRLKEWPDKDRSSVCL